MDLFSKQHQDVIWGSLSGWDRVRFMGTLRLLAVASGMMHFLYAVNVLLKNFSRYVERQSQLIKKASLALALDAQRPCKYISSGSVCKEAEALKIAAQDGITSGLVCVISCVEPCRTYDLHRDAVQKKLVLNVAWRKCLHLYHYLIDETFGWMSIRIQTWFPFTIQVCINGRECLARRMDQEGLRYTRQDNCFTWIEDLPRAQTLMNELLSVNWPQELDRIAKRANPGLAEVLALCPVPYYWSAQQTEWATDVMFKSPEALEKVYPALVRGALTAFSSPDVMRFLGRKLHGRFKGEIVSDMKVRPEGVRIKHRVNQNSVKAYNKQGSVLRVETTLNDPSEFKNYRSKEGDPGGPKSWRQMRRGVADLHRRAMVSHASNTRYLNALASLDTDDEVGALLRPVCRRVEDKGRKVRGLRPWTEEDQALLRAVSDGAFALNGFRNRDLLKALGLEGKDKRKASAKISRLLRMLRAHGLIYKVQQTNRYMLSKKGRTLASTLLHIQTVSLAKLAKIAA